MSLLDNVRQTITDVAGSVMEQSKTFSAQTQLQVSIKKMQMERAKRIHELGKQTFDWYRAGQLTVSGPVPDGISGLCRELSDIEHQLTASEAELERLKREADAPSLSNPTGDTYTSTASPAPDPNAPAAPAAGAPPYTPPAYSPPQQPYSPPPPPAGGQPYAGQPHPGQPYTPPAPPAAPPYTGQPYTPPAPPSVPGAPTQVLPDSTPPAQGAPAQNPYPGPPAGS